MRDASFLKIFEAWSCALLLTKKGGEETKVSPPLMIKLKAMASFFFLFSTNQKKVPLSLHHKNRRLGVFIVLCVLSMGALSFASVPLYRLFCQKTGYGGTPQKSLRRDFHVGSGGKQRVMTIRFNADVGQGLLWDFHPLQDSLQIQVGQTALAFYQVYNRTSNPMVGVAIYNVTPDKAAFYFHKIECFCFEEQTLLPHRPLEMPVQFFIDPEIVRDPDLQDVDTITLSYTFFPVKDPNLKQFRWNAARRS